MKMKYNHALSDFILSFPCSCCWSITWRLSARVRLCAGLVLGRLCHWQQRQPAREGSLRQWTPLLKRPACSSFLASSFIQLALKMDHTEGSGPQQGCDRLGKPDMSPTPLAAFVCSPSPPQGCVKAAKQLSQSPGLFILVQKCCRECSWREHICVHARLAAVCTLARRCCTDFPAPCCKPSVLVSCQCWHEGVSLDCW